MTSAVGASKTTLGAWQALPRGGYYVRTSAGAVQIGMPPETIKDVMELKLDVPVAYAVAILVIGMSALLLYADIVNPVKLPL